jgi:hypothetical protein
VILSDSAIDPVPSFYAPFEIWLLSELKNTLDLPQRKLFR